MERSDARIVILWLLRRECTEPNGIVELTTQAWGRASSASVVVLRRRVVTERLHISEQVLGPVVVLLLALEEKLRRDGVTQTQNIGRRIARCIHSSYSGLYLLNAVVDVLVIEIGV